MLLAVADLLELRAGETAYYIGRAVAGSGFRPFCDLCSTEAKYVDGSAQLGFPHTYTVSAIFPWGTSKSIASNQVTRGASSRKN